MNPARIPKGIPEVMDMMLPESQVQEKSMTERGHAVVTTAIVKGMGIFIQGSIFSYINFIIRRDDYGRRDTQDRPPYGRRDNYERREGYVNCSRLYVTKSYK